MIGQPSHLGRIAVVFAPPESTFRAGKTPRMAEKSAEWATRNSPTKCRFGAAASPVCPAVFFILAQRKPMPAQKLSDVAASAKSPAIFPRGNQPLGRPKTTSATKLSGALRRLRRRRVVRRRTSPTRRNKTDARTSSQGSRLFFRLAIVSILEELATRDHGARREPKIRTKRHFGVVALVIFPAAATM